MRTTGLKTHIVVTIVLLLATSTLLAGLVITMFWQQNLIQAEANRVRTALEIISLGLQPDSLRDQKQTPAFFSRARETTGLDCLATLDQNVQEIVSLSGSCKNTIPLNSLLHESVQTNAPLAETYGSTWGVFTLRPEYLLMAVPIGSGQLRGSLGSVTSLKPVYHRIRQKQKTIIIYLVVNILLITTIGFFRLVKSTVKPVERLVRITEEYDEENDFHLFTAKEGSEFGQLSTALNSMIQRIDNDRKQLRDTVASLEEANARLKQTQEEMIRTEKLASIGRLSAGLAHEIGNPIGIIQGYLELLQRKSLTGEDRLQFAQRAASELNRINHLIRQLLDFARTSPPGRQQVRTHELIEDIHDLFKTRRKMDHILFQLDLQAQSDLLETSEEGLRQVLLNCLLNAVDAVEEKGPGHRGKIVISTRDEASDKAPFPSLIISIRDNGCGMTKSQLPAIFDPFFTTKEPGKGTGLGLSVSHTIIESLGGRITVQSEIGQGTEINIILPRPG